MPEAPSARRGLLAAGNFIIDHVKIIDYFPAEETLATILSQSSHNGGGPYNVLKDLAKMGAEFPLEAAGLLGNDDNARWIIQDCLRHGIGAGHLRQSADHATSYTDAFTVQSTGRRTFFHQPGANAHLAPGHFDFSPGGFRIFYLGYLMLLDTLDAIGADGRTGASRVLESAKQSGMRTVVDLVSKKHPIYAESVAASLPWVDCLILNEIEAGWIVGRNLQADGRLDVPAAVAAVRGILDSGVGEWVVLHSVDGAVAVGRGGEVILQGSVRLPQERIAGATGAGDAFAAGILFALHENFPMQRALQLAVCVAASCLAHPSTSEGILPRAECEALGGQFGFRTLDG
jgi:sugar/nucleoside kinase (ribokinase family)